VFRDPALRTLRPRLLVLLFATAWAAAVHPLGAQELEPRAYSASPVGMTFLVIGAGRSSGSVLIDPSLPLDDVRARLGVATVGIGRTFDLASRTALVVVAVPYARARLSGQLGAERADAQRFGWADTRTRLSVNLVGGRAMRAREFAAARRGPILGASLSVVAPTGSYRSSRLVNLGSNRWSFKPELGVSVPAGRWTLETYGGCWLFTENDAFYPGTAAHQQAPVASLQAHASYSMRPRLWVALNATWYTGGVTSINGVEKADLQRNSRIGTAISIPFGRRQSLKAAFSTGTTTRIGGDFETVAVTWQIAWLRP